MFYEGDKNADAIFLGALTDGGAERLRNPFAEGHKTALDRQMSIFPNTEKELRMFLASLKTGEKLEIPDKKIDAEAIHLAKREEQLADLKLLKENIKKIPKPKDS